MLCTCENIQESCRNYIKSMGAPDYVANKKIRRGNALMAMIIMVMMFIGGFVVLYIKCQEVNIQRRRIEERNE